MPTMMRAGMTPPNKGRRYPAEVLEAAEVQALLDQLSRKSATGIRNRALVVLLYKSGLRVSEICNLTPADINLEPKGRKIRGIIIPPTLASRPADTSMLTRREPTLTPSL